MKTIIFAYSLLTFSSIAPCVAEEYSPDTLQAAAVQLMPAAHVAPDPNAISKDTLRLNPKLEWMDNDFLPHFRRPVDDYMQYLPAVVMVGLKAAGIPSRSSWGRMLLSDMFTVTAMGLTVDGLKRTTQVTRPDGTNRHSFPSGHTATAFMTATMLTKEYGHHSPWVGVGAYSLATATGLMRVANNKHWLSDVMVGAGIGILSTELGYWLADLIMKDKGLNVKDSPEMYAALFRPTPSFLSLTVGFSLPLSHYDIREGEAFETTTDHHGHRHRTGGSLVFLSLFRHRWQGFGCQSALHRQRPGRARQYLQVLHPSGGSLLFPATLQAVACGQ